MWRLRQASRCRGGFDGDEAERLSILRSAAQQGARYIDVELDVAEAFFAGATVSAE